MKNIGSIIAILIAVLSCGLAFKYNQRADKSQEELNTERYTRMTAEEGLTAADEKIRSLTAEIERSQKKIKGIETKLEQVIAINDDLKARLDKAAEIKDNLEAKIKELQQLSSGTGMVGSMGEI